MICPVCDKPFTPRTSRQRFCSDECQREDYSERAAGGDDGSKPAMTFEEIGKAMGIGQSGADHIEKKALNKLRQQMRRARLRLEDFL